MMKITFYPVLLAGIMALTSCKDSADSTKEDGSSNESGKSASADTKELRKQLNKFKRDPRVTDDPEIQAASIKMMEANKALMKMRDEHPDTAELSKKDDELKNAMIKAKIDDDDAAYDKIMSEYKDVRIKLEAAVQKSEALKPLRDARDAASKAVDDAERAALARIPEAKELLEKLGK